MPATLGQTITLPDALITGKSKDIRPFKGPITGSVKAGLPDRQSSWTRN